MAPELNESEQRFGAAAITKLDPYAVQSYMGHQHFSTTQRYLHHKPRGEDAAALQEAFGIPLSRHAEHRREIVARHS